MSDPERHVEKLILLVIGEKGATHRRIQTTIFLLSRFYEDVVFPKDYVPSRHGAYSRTVRKTLVEGEFWEKKGQKYVLTENGKTIYNIMVEDLRKQIPEFARLLDIFTKLDDKILREIELFLYPEYTKGWLEEKTG